MVYYTLFFIWLFQKETNVSYDLLKYEQLVKKEKIINGQV